ncbi:hypothetical protein DRP05_02760 [Archaeoglobales archaeon]|nr:MAG: hypothetical protein DRP05_02760 [Archaeoglobales archaeon]
MKYLNLYSSRAKLPEKIPGYYIRLENIPAEKKADRRAFLQSIANRLNIKGVDCAVVPKQLTDSFDIAILNLSEDKISKIEKGLSRYAPKVVGVENVESGIIKAAWQNRVRTHLTKKGLIKIGDRYILKKDMLSDSNYKSALRIQAVILNGYPSMYIDPRTRVMISLSNEIISKADELDGESEIRVRVLPNWTGGILMGKSGFKAGEKEFPYGSKMYSGDKYWRVRYSIDFITAEDEMLDVYIPSYERTFSYPRKCVFLEFRRGMTLPDNLKKDPDLRVKESLGFIKRIQPIQFINRRLEFVGPITVSDMGFKEYNYPSGSNFYVIVGGHNRVAISRVHSALRKHGPFAGAIGGRYIVFYPDEINRKLVEDAFNKVENTYSGLKLGELKPYTGVGDRGFIETGTKVTDYTSAIMEARPKLNSFKDRLITVVVLPSNYASEVYYKSRSKLFDRIFGFNPLRVQSVMAETINEMAESGNTAYPASVNIASQCYIKLGGTGSAIWVLDEAADTPIRGISAGSSCYAYHDVSRRPKMKASATAYSALTDPYGRFIATGTKPVGGEKLTPTTFYDIIIELLEKIAIFNGRFKEIDKRRKFEFKRLVFAKDGIIRDEEAEMMEKVILEGVPEEGRDPIWQVIKNIPMLPNDLVMDIIGVNKSPNKRLFEFNGKYRNVGEGTAISFNERTGLLVSSSTHVGTIQPLEITLHCHIYLNTNVPTPHISEIMDEYFRLTHLDWASIFKQGKYALPQILTQNLGENVSAGVVVPEDMVLL